MQITDLLARSGGLEAIARELGIGSDQAAQGAAALVPAILGGFSKQASAHPGGLEGLGGLLGQLGGGGLLDQVLAPEPTDTSRGDAVLGHIFGSRDVSRTVAQHASERTGLDPELLKRMLPMLAMLVSGFLAKQGGPGASLGTAASGGTAGGLGGMLGGLLGAATRGHAGGGGAGAFGGLGQLLDANGDGNALDDILRMAGKLR